MREKYVYSMYTRVYEKGGTWNHGINVLKSEEKKLTNTGKDVNNHVEMWSNDKQSIS